MKKTLTVIATLIILSAISAQAYDVVCPEDYPDYNLGTGVDSRIRAERLSEAPYFEPDVDLYGERTRERMEEKRKEDRLLEEIRQIVKDELGN